MSTSSSTKIQVRSSTSIEKDLAELVQMMSTWPTWKIESLQNDNRNIMVSQILHQKIVVIKNK